jgi:phosphinothricin acetyltransferase
MIVGSRPDGPQAGVLIRPAQTVDAGAMARIYNHYVLNSYSTFEDQPLSSQAFAKRIQKVSAASLPWLVAESGGELAGYAYASLWKERPAYRYSVESSVYVDPRAQRAGIGSQLYAALLDELHRKQIHAVIGGIALPNPASVRLHEKFGFRKVAHFEAVGYKLGRWIDVGYWQLIIDSEISWGNSSC